MIHHAFFYLTQVKEKRKVPSIIFNDSYLLSTLLTPNFSTDSVAFSTGSGSTGSGSIGSGSTGSGWTVSFSVTGGGRDVGSNSCCVSITLGPAATTVSGCFSGSLSVSLHLNKAHTI